MERARIGVTGIGLVCSSGNTGPDAWANVVDGVCTITRVTSIDTGWLGSRYAGQVEGFEPERLIAAERLDEMVRSSQLAIVAGAEALATSGLQLEELDLDRVGLVMGTCQGTLAELRGTNPRILDSVHVASDDVAHHFGLHGPRAMISTACSAGANAIGFARDRLWNDEADVMLAGGTDSLTFFSMAGFGVMGALDPEPCAPYSRSNGLSLGEGAALLVLERLDRAEARGATVLAELIGWGTSADAYHPSAPDPTGRGPALAMARAMQQGGLAVDDVAYVNGHGTGTPANDAMERQAMRAIFGGRVKDVPCSSSKSMIGHTLGTAGAIEAAFTIFAIRDGIVPPTANFGIAVEPEFDFVPNVARHQPVPAALSNSYTFGGSNTCVALASRRDEAPPVDGAGLGGPVFVTGIGAVGPIGSGREAWWSALADGRCGLGPIEAFDTSPYHSGLGGIAPRLEARGLAAPSAWRKMDPLARQCVASSRQAWTDAGLDLGPAAMERVAVVMGTNAGSLEQSEAFDRGARRGSTTANPILFPNAALNAAAGWVCMTMGLRGPTCTFTSGGISSLVALAMGCDLIRQGEIDLALIVGADTLYETMFAAACGRDGFVTADAVRPFDERASGTALSGASVTVVLESAAHCRERGATALCEVLGGAMTGDDADPFAVAGTGPSAAWERAIGSAVTRSALLPEQIGYVAAAAPGIRSTDETEAAALGRVFPHGPKVGAPKSVVGECLGAGGLVNVLAAAMAVRDGRLAPTAGLEEPLRAHPLRHAVAGDVADTAYTVANAVGLGGSYASVVLGAAPGAA